MTTSQPSVRVFVFPADQHRYRATEHSPAEFEHLISVDTQLDAGEILFQHHRIPDVPIAHGQSFLWTAPCAATDSVLIPLCVVMGQEVLTQASSQAALRAGFEDVPDLTDGVP